MDSSTPDPRVPLVELRHVGYTLKGRTIIHDVNLSISEGEIHAFVGDRGTGKSTLARLIGLIDQPTEGRVVWRGKEVRGIHYRSLSTPRIQFIHQEEGLIDYFCVAENIFLPEKVFRPFPFASHKKMAAKAGELISRYGFLIDPLQSVSTLNMSERTIISLLRCIYRDPEILVLDETLEKLSGIDYDRVIAILRDLAAQGVAIICISHRIDDIYTIARNVSVIREGRILLTDSTKNIDRLNLIKMCYTQITRNKESEDINREFYQLLRYNEAILKNLPITLIVTDDQDHIKMINDQGQSFLRIQPEEYLDRPISRLFPQRETYQEIETLLREDHESRLFNKVIADVVVNIRTYPIFDGKFRIGSIIIIEDITEQEQLRHRMNLSENLASLGLLAAGVAHEINNPLEIIYNYLSFLRMHPSKELALETVGQLEEEIDGIKHIVSNLVSFSGNKVHGTEHFSINDLIRQTLTLLSPAAKERGISCRFSSQEEDLQIHANRTEIRQVLLNLIKNSFEVLGPGGTVSITIEQEDDKLLMRIMDDGPGITTDNPDQIFLPFYSTKKGDTNNLGLGIPMSYSIVKKYQGELTYRNIPGGGCEFLVTLPML